MGQLSFFNLSYLVNPQSRHSSALLVQKSHMRRIKGQYQGVLTPTMMVGQAQTKKASHTSQNTCAVTTATMLLGRANMQVG